MVRVFLALSASLALMAPIAVTVATTVTFTNDCSYDINLYDNSDTTTIAQGSSTSKTLSSGFSGMFRHGTGDEATLAEFAVSGGYTWYDISVIPPGSGSCTSYEACKTLTGKTGYNVAMSITPINTDGTSVSSACAAIDCESDDCEDAYLYPSDDLKTHNCPESLDFTVAFCPNGSSSSTSSTTTTTTPTTTTTTPTSTSSDEVAGDYDSGTVNAYSASSTSTSTTTTSTTSTTTSTSTTSGSAVSFADATIASSFSYTGTDAGSATGSYDMVTATSSCTTESVSMTSPVGPLSEEVSMVFRGPMNLYNIAVFNGGASGDWTKVSSYSADEGTSDNLIFLNNLNIDYTGADKSPQGFSSSDGLSTATEATQFGGYLAEASSPTTVGGGPGVSTAVEVNIMTPTACSEDGTCKGYYDDNGYHGWDGGRKMFVTKVMMPDSGSSPNLPAIWMLNAQVLRSAQYGCNCRNSGAAGGCGELDIAEVIETNTAQDKISTHYYFYDGSVSPGGDNYAARPTSSATTYITIFDNTTTSGTIKVLEIGGDDFDFNATTVADTQVQTWLSASDVNLISRN